MKKIICIIITFIMAVGLFIGCSSNTSENNTRETSKDTGKRTEDTTQPSSQKTTVNSGKTLVVYYSATGSTRAVAETIAEETGADLFEITPVQPYTNDDLNWSDDSSRVSKEHNDEQLRDVELTQVTPDNWKEYDTILIGYPIWWGIAAWPVDNFVKGNDFSGKIVIPFCTSASSGIGDSANLLQSMAETGDWQEGYRFSSRVSKSEIQKWIDSLNINK